MAKNMYQKRTERKNNKISPEQDKGVNKSVINWYPGHMAKAKRLIKEKMNVIDIVLEVIDARMPYSSKIQDIETCTGNKPRLLIMTKIDLCDWKETSRWILYYQKKGYKVVPLNLEENKNIIKPIIDATDEIMQNIMEKRKQKGMKNRKTRILVIGIPNVGKSTLINRLASKKAANVGNKPGITKSLDWIRINDTLDLLDSPGILWPKLEEEKVAFHLASLSAIKEEILPIFEVATYILKFLIQYYPTIALERYGVEKLEEDISLTFDQIGKKRGAIIKGGETDYDKVCKIILNDMKNGLVKGVTFDRMKDYEL